MNEFLTGVVAALPGAILGGGLTKLGIDLWRDWQGKKVRRHMFALEIAANCDSVKIQRRHGNVFEAPFMTAFYDSNASNLTVFCDKLASEIMAFYLFLHSTRVIQKAAFEKGGTEKEKSDLAKSNEEQVEKVGRELLERILYRYPHLASKQLRKAP